MRLLEYTGVLVIWGVLLLAALSMHDMSYLDRHSVCGPWGCGPPTNALLAMHVGWCAAIWPPLFYFPWRLKWAPQRVRTIGAALFTLGVIGLLGTVTWQWVVWLPDASRSARTYFWHRCGFSILVITDWPLMQATIGGALLWIWRRPVRTTDLSEDAEIKEAPLSD